MKAIFNLLCLLLLAAIVAITIRIEWVGEDSPSQKQLGHEAYCACIASGDRMSTCASAAADSPMWRVDFIREGCD